MKLLLSNNIRPAHKFIFTFTILCFVFNTGCTPKIEVPTPINPLPTVTIVPSATSEKANKINSVEGVVAKEDLEGYIKQVREGNEAYVDSIIEPFVIPVRKDEQVYNFLFLIITGLPNDPEGINIAEVSKDGGVSVLLLRKSGEDIELLRENGELVISWRNQIGLWFFKPDSDLVINHSGSMYKNIPILGDKSIMWDVAFQSIRPEPFIGPEPSATPRPNLSPEPTATPVNNTLAICDGYLCLGNGKRVQEGSMDIPVEAVYPSRTWPGEFTVVQDGRPSRIASFNEDTELVLTGVGMDRQVYRDNTWYKFQGTDWEKMATPTTTDENYLVDPSLLSEGQRQIMDQAGPFTYYDKEGPVLLGWSMYLDKPVALGYGDTVVGVYDVDGSISRAKQWIRAYGGYSMIFLTDKPNEKRYFPVDKVTGDEPQNVAYIVNFVRAAIFCNKLPNSIQLPDEAYDNKSLYFVTGEGAKYFSRESSLGSIKTERGLVLPITKPMYISFSKAVVKPRGVSAKDTGSDTIVVVTLSAHDGIPYNVAGYLGVSSASVKEDRLYREKVRKTAAIDIFASTWLMK